MTLQTGLYEVLTSAEGSSVHGDFEGIETTHTKHGWIKNVGSQSVTKLSIANTTMPLIPGKRIGISFLNGEVIAFKQSEEIPVEDPVGNKNLRRMPIAILMAVVFSLVFSIPILGYIYGAVVGVHTLFTGNNFLGRYSKMRGGWVYGIFLLVISLFSWIPAQVSGSLEGIVAIYIALAAFMLVVTVVTQVIKVSTENKIYAQAVVELNKVWRK